MKVLVYSEYKYEFIDEILYKGLIGNLNKNSIFLYAPVSTKLPAYFNNKLSQTIFGEDIKDKIDDFDLILFTNTALFDKYFGFALDRDSEIKRIFIDGVDDFFVRRIYVFYYLGHVLRAFCLKAVFSYLFWDLSISV